jgi:TnpA family transposase
LSLEVNTNVEYVEHTEVTDIWGEITITSFVSRRVTEAKDGSKGGWCRVSYIVGIASGSKA